MKRSIIILVALIVLCAMPVLAKPMVVVTNPLLDDGFMLDELNEEELTIIIGQGMYVNDPDIAADYTKQTMKNLGNGTYEVTTYYFNFEVEYNNGKPVYLKVTYYVTTTIISESGNGKP